MVSTATFRHSTITFAGTFANGVFGAIFYILAARFLGPAAFGLLSVALAVLTLTSDIGDLGTDTGLVNFVARNFDNDETKAKRFLKLGFEIKIAVWLVILGFGIATSSFLAEVVFRKPELTQPIKIAFVGMGAMLMFSFILHTLQALQKFWSWSIIQAGTNALRVIMVLALLGFGYLNLNSTIWLYIAMPTLGFVIGLYLIPRGFLKVRGEKKIAREFFHYNKWVAAFTLMAALSSRLDTFISARLLDAAQVGLYSAAIQMVKIVPQLVTALGTVIAPKMAQIGSIEDLVRYLKKTQVLVFFLAILGVMAIPVVLYLIPFLFGSEYTASGPIFAVLLFAMLFFLISVPVHMSIFYYFSYPKLFFWLSIVHLTIIAGLGWVLVSRYGAIGAATSVLVAQVVGFIVPALWVIRQITRRRLRKATT